MSEEKKSNKNSYIIVTVGVLIGFLCGFVILLANLPDNPNTQYSSTQSAPVIASSTSYEFYKMLPDSKDVLIKNTDVYTPDDVSFRRKMTKPSASRSLKNIYNFETRKKRPPKLTEIPASKRTDTYYLQAGSFTYEWDAQKLRAKLILNGLDAFVKPSHIKGKLHHRVRLGPYYDKQALGSARESLREKGISYMVLRVKG